MTVEDAAPHEMTVEAPKAAPAAAAVRGTMGAEAEAAPEAEGKWETHEMRRKRKELLRSRKLREQAHAPRGPSWRQHA